MRLCWEQSAPFLDERGRRLFAAMPEGVQFFDDEMRFSGQLSRPERKPVTHVWFDGDELLGLKRREFVEAAHALGASDSRIMLRHLAPNVLTPIIVISSFQFAQIIIAEASLSFLGVGVQPPTPSWGSMLSQGREYLGTSWWLGIFPGIAIMLAVLGTNMFGDGLRDALDPRLKV